MKKGNYGRRRCPCNSESYQSPTTTRTTTPTTTRTTTPTTLNIGSDASNSKEKKELIGKDEADDETGKNSEESNEVSEEESSDPTSLAAVNEMKDSLPEKPTVRLNTKSPLSGKSSGMHASLEPESEPSTKGEPEVA